MTAMPSPPSPRTPAPGFGRPVPGSAGLLRAWRIQWRVMSALIRREMIALTGKSPFGFLVLLLEPFIFVLVLALAFILKTDSFKDVPVIEFCFSGYCVLWACRFHIVKMMSVIVANRALLYHRHVKIMDVLIARAFIQCLTTTVSILALIPLVLFGIIKYPHDVKLIIFSWLFVQWYGFTFAIISGALVGLYKFGLKLCIILGGVHVFITGAFVMVHWLPHDFQKYMLVFPMVHATEMMRDGLFGQMATTYYSFTYATCSIVVLMYVAMALNRLLAKRTPVEDSI